MMNYDPGTISDGRLALTGETSARSRGWLIGAAILLILIIGVVSYWALVRAKPADDANSADQLSVVTVAVPGTTMVERSITATGSLAARVDMPVGVAGEGGIITRVLVEPGSWVSAGQVLATIDRSVQVQTGASLSAQIAVAKSDARLAQAELDRAKSLVDNGFISKADLDRKAAARDAANARVAVAEATLAETRARTNRLDIRAPAAGLILTRNVEPGQVVGAGSGTLFRLARGGELEVKAALSEADLATIKPGSAASVTPVGSAASFSGRVWQVSPVIDPQTRQGIARVALGYDSALRPGGFAAVRIVGGVARAPLLPQSAIQSDDKGNFVYIINAKDEAERRAVKTGQVSDQGVAIESGLSGSERVVVSAGAFLNPGQKVKPTAQRNQG